MSKRTRYDLKSVFDFRSTEGRRKDPRAMWVQAPPWLRTIQEFGPTGRPRKDSHIRRRAMREGVSGRLRYDPDMVRSTAAPAITGMAKEKTLPLKEIKEPAFFVLAVMDAPKGILSADDRELLGAARLLSDEKGGAVVALVPAGCQGLSAAGADRVLERPPRTEGGYEAEHLSYSILPALDRLNIRHVILGDQVTGRDTAQRVAIALNELPAIGVHHLSAETCVRTGYGRTKDLTQAVPRVLTLATGAGSEVTGARFEARPIIIEIPVLETKIKDLGLETLVAADIPLEEAPFILAAGAGLTDWDHYGATASMLNATQAGTRVVCDSGAMPRDRQIGASGHLVKADYYLALGISGAIQHLQGIEGCSRVVAVNLDAHAPIVKRADLTIIGDANAVIAALHSRLEMRS